MSDVNDDITIMRAELAAMPAGECDAFLAGWMAAASTVEHLANEMGGGELIFVGPVLHALAETARVVNPNQ